MTQLTNFILQKLQEEVYVTNKSLVHKLLIGVLIPFVIPMILYVSVVAILLLVVFVLFAIPALVIQSWFNLKERKNGNTKKSKSI